MRTETIADRSISDNLRLLFGGNYPHCAFSRSDAVAKTKPTHAKSPSLSTGFLEWFWQENRASLTVFDRPPHPEAYISPGHSSVEPLG
ncbi:hypothetical protein ACWD7M_20740 [Streptomyces griseus]